RAERQAEAGEPVAEADAGGFGVGSGADVAGVVAADGVPREAADEHTTAVEPPGRAGDGGLGGQPAPQQRSEGRAGAARGDLPAGGVAQRRAEQSGARGGG